MIRFVVILASVFLALGNAHHVLFVHSAGTKSHLILMKPLIEELLAKDHQVTSIFFNSIKIDHANYTEIVVPSKMDAFYASMSKRVANGGGNVMNPSFWLWLYNFYQENMKEMALDVLSDEVMELIKAKPKIDAMLTFFPGNAFFAEIFDCPLINFSPLGPVILFMTGSGNVINHSVQPYVAVPFLEPMTFLQRFGNHAMMFFGKHFMVWQANALLAHQKEYLKDEVGLDMSSAETVETVLRERISLVISCSHPITHGAWQYLPNVVEVGGLQLKDAKPLEGDLKKFMDSATEGAVLVSFGSSLKPDQMPQEKIQVFIDTFKQLGMKVIWKWDKEMPGLPDNILLSSWLPQQDLLAHPNLRVFVTHGGLGSLVEAIYHKAVIVGIPLSNDQKPNLLRAERHGYAVSLDWDEMTADELVESIKKAMGDKEMAANLERIHNLYLDREEKPVEKAAWWVEYVCRHGGADWLKSIGEDVPFYQYHHLDIILVLAIAALISLTGTFFFWRTVFRCLCGKKTKID